MKNLFVTLQNQEIKTVVVPTNVTPAQIFAVSLMRTAYYGLTNIIRSDDPTQYENIPECIMIDLGGGEYDTISNPQTREDGSNITPFTLVWNDIKKFYDDDLQDTFEQNFIIPTEQGNLMSEYIEKIMKSGTTTSFMYALNAAYRILKVWTING